MDKKKWVMQKNDRHSYQGARKKVECLRSFYINLTAYFMFVPLMAYINYRTNPFPWAIIPALIWGLGLLFWWVTLWRHLPFMGTAWEARKIKKFMEDDEL